MLIWWCHHFDGIPSHRTNSVVSGHSRNLEKVRFDVLIWYLSYYKRGVITFDHTNVYTYIHTIYNKHINTYMDINIYV